VDFASVSDPLADPRSPLMGTRTLGDDPATAGRLAAALVRGLQAAGVAATLRHFPGRGSVAGDSRHELPISDVDGVTLRACQTVPFATGIRAGVRLVMLGHRAAPADTDSRAVSAALAPELACLLLRDELGFEGVSVTDALDTGAYGSPENFPEIAVAAAAAGADLLLTVLPAALEDAAIEALAAALRDGRLDRSAARTAAHRIRGLRRWIGRSAPAPGLEVVGSSEHRSLAREIAERSVTLLRDRDRLLPLRVDPDTRVVVIAPLPTDLTPGDTSSRLRLRLADALRAGGLSIDELIMPIDPTPSDIAALRASLGDARCAIVGTIDALVHDGQARLVRALVDDGMRTVAVALRTPLDLVAYPAVSTAVATYGIQAPSVEALAAALLGRIPFRGRLPVRLDPELLGGGR
jgi:beta-N-acetylhexosaminidase